MFHFLHSWNVPKYFVTKRETQVGIQHSFDVVFSVVGTGMQQCSFPHFSETFLETQYLIALYEKSSY